MVLHTLPDQAYMFVIIPITAIPCEIGFPPDEISAAVGDDVRMEKRFAHRHHFISDNAPDFFQGGSHWIGIIP